MDKFATLEPVKLYATSTAAGARLLGLSTTKAPTVQHLIGRLPIDLHFTILSYLAIPDIPSYSRCSRAVANLAREEGLWRVRWRNLGVDKHGLACVLDDLETHAKGRVADLRASAPPTLAVDTIEDEFGDFTSGVDAAAHRVEELGDFVGGFDGGVSPGRTPMSSKPSYRQMYIRAHNLLKPLLSSLSSAPHLILSTLFPPPSPSVRQQSQTLHLLSLFLSSTVRPVRNWETHYSALRSAVDRFEANLLGAFDVADSNGDERGMREAATASWEVWEGHTSNGRIKVAEWEMGKVWGEKREVFYQQGQWRPLDNFTKDGILDFDAMDEFMTYVLDAVRRDGATAVRVFPPDARVLLSFADRLALEVVGEYVSPLLTKAREISNEVFLKATAASFREAWRMVDVLVEVGGVSAQKGEGASLTRTQAEDVIFQMFETNMDEYLDEEIESVKQAFDVICRDWERKTSAPAQLSSAEQKAPAARFLGSHNPAQMKRNVLASFTDILLLPVTIVPRTVGAVGAVLTTGGSAAVQGIAMLNPQRWGSQAGGGGGGRSMGYSKNFEKEDAVLFEVGADADEYYIDEKKEARSSISSSSHTTLEVPSTSTAPTSLHSRSSSSSRTSTPAPSTNSRALSPSASSAVAAFDKLELMLSLDVALELIHADREALKRAETFAAYPGSYGHRVRDTIEEVFIVLLQAMGERHICPGFERATEQMRTYKPAEHEETTSVAPLMQFFELVHIGDTIQSMVQVYFDKELAPHIDKTDFLNAVVREKKRFENALDDSVAAGLNAGTEVLMNQVEHIILTQTQAREYYPAEDAPMDLDGPTAGCKAAVACLETHCRLLRGSTSKEVLEVFYQEVGIRLLAILHKHIKRQIISLLGGFQVIADLNAYHAFVSSLKIPSITADFSHLKMLGHVYVVEDAKDLAQIVRDVTRYGGAYRPEDIYEFIQRRADWKKIEKTVDKTMYNLSFKEDCVIC